VFFIAGVPVSRPISRLLSRSATTTSFLTIKLYFSMTYIKVSMQSDFNRVWPFWSIKASMQSDFNRVWPFWSHFYTILFSIILYNVTKSKGLVTWFSLYPLFVDNGL